jgi:hypothetical protein
MPTRWRAGRWKPADPRTDAIFLVIRPLRRPAPGAFVCVRPPVVVDDQGVSLRIAWVDIDHDQELFFDVGDRL